MTGLSGDESGFGGLVLLRIQMNGSEETSFKVTNYVTANDVANALLTFIDRIRILPPQSDCNAQGVPVGAQTGWATDPGRRRSS